MLKIIQAIIWAGGFPSKDEVIGNIEHRENMSPKISHIEPCTGKWKGILFSFTVITTECGVSQINKSRMFCIWCKCSAGDFASNYMFEPSEIYIGDMLNITKSLQGKETHGLGVLHLIHNIHWLASSRKLRFIHNEREQHTSVWLYGLLPKGGALVEHLWTTWKQRK